jgi:hypothetical protein
MSNARTRRPGEAVFTLLLAAVSAFLMWTAYGIAGFEALSSPGALPMAAAGTMLFASVAIAAQTLSRRPRTGETLSRDVLPLRVVVTVVLVAAYAVLLKPVGFLPVSFVFVLALMRILGQRNLAVCAAISAAGVLTIYVVFRVIFNVMMPEGIVPEREVLAFLRSLFAGAR